MSAAFVPTDYFKRHSVSDIFEGEEFAGKPLEVDLGCGDGGFLLGMAEHFQERNFLGVERLLGRVRKVCRDSEKKSLNNVRALRLESRYFLEFFVAAGSISRLHYLFPDPWPKEKHHKNRLVQEDFIPVLHAALAPAGELCFKTDHEDYYIWCCERLDASPLFQRVDWDLIAEFYPKTDFQQQWEAMGKEIFAAKYIKVESPAQS